MKCPVCDNELKHWSDTEEGRTLESQDKCETCGYMDSFAYGASEEYIGSVCLHSHYTDSEEERSFQSNVRSYAIAHARVQHFEKLTNKS
jgi:hypothetical protein